MLMCEGKGCGFTSECVGRLHSPAFSWYCPDCNDDPYQYCLCNQAEFGLMVCCDNRECDTMWYHISCVGLKGAPSGVWLCPKCK
ncbi:Inhibitor of growth protein 1 [Exaiptasia diaphana]|nr:Inhibitor of growth protein 1 [Exaiptasia diaphana]